MPSDIFGIPGWSAAAISSKQPARAVPGVIAEGVNLLAGPPKVGKSWLSLGLGPAVAAGTNALSSIAVTSEPVLYLALEDRLDAMTKLDTLLGGGK